MNVVIYTTSAQGGCYDYARQLHQAYSGHSLVDRCVSLFPENADIPARRDFKKMLLPDRTDSTKVWDKKRLFIQRSLRNPIKLLNYLRDKPPSLVIFNDWEQISAPLWVPLFRGCFGDRHLYAVILHDPDRDAYPPNLRTSQFCMRSMMRLMDFGLYHEYLPTKSYYASNGRTQYINVPHGLYPSALPDVAMHDFIATQLQPGLSYAAILGNIREEKNYELAIRALQQFPQLGLVIAGKASTRHISVDGYKSLAEELGVSSRIVWIERFLTEGEMAAVIESVSWLLLYYASSFTSQSGVLNTAAPMRKPIIASDGTSSLASTLRRFPIGLLAKPDSLPDLCKVLARALDGFGPDAADWASYLEYASWDSQVDAVLSAAKVL